jgi:hypothetical protein
MQINPIYGTKILPLRWFANWCEVVAHYHLSKALHYDDHDDNGFIYTCHAFLSKWFYKPYFKWGTTYQVERLRSDYDEDGLSYWHYHEVNCACTKCMP